LVKEEVHYLACASETLRALEQPGLLLVTQGKAGKANIMTIGWATIGILWGRRCFVILVRPSRHSYSLLEENGEFTVNVLPADKGEAAAFCGSVSGREHDKFAECGLTALPAKQVKAPIIKECVIHYECRVIHHNDINAATMPEDVTQMAYPEGDHHRLYYGEILACLTEPDAAQRL
jgi:flavin reductase (DIM6/NTAB) family NADH-FMN oxidoreductase RutF